MCCNTGHNINLVAFHPGRPYGSYQITILRHQVHTMVIMIINSIIKIVTIFINILNILISSMMMMMMKSGGFSYGGFSYILCSYILRSYFGCTPSSLSSSSSASSKYYNQIRSNVDFDGGWVADQVCDPLWVDDQGFARHCTMQLY